MIIRIINVDNQKTSNVNKVLFNINGAINDKMPIIESINTAFKKINCLLYAKFNLFFSRVLFILV